MNKSNYFFNNSDLNISSNNLFHNFPAISTPSPDFSSKNDKEIYNYFVFILNVFVFGITSVFGFLGNLTSIIVLQKDHHNKVAIFLLQVLATADSFLLTISFLILTIFFGIIKEFSPNYYKKIIPFVVVYVNQIGKITHCLVVWYTVLLSINRYAAVCKPFKSKKFLKISSARIQVFIVFIISVGLNLPCFLTYKIESFYNVTLSNSTNVLVKYENLPALKDLKTEVTWSNYGYTVSELGLSNAFNLYYLSIFYTSFVLILPLFILISLNVPLIKQLQISKKLMQSNCLSYDGKNENNITCIMVVIICELIICHVPDRICQVAKHLSNNQDSNLKLLYAQNISNLFILLSSSSDFIIYYLLKKRFRKDFWKKVSFCFGKQIININEILTEEERKMSHVTDSFHGNLGPRFSLKDFTRSNKFFKNSKSLLNKNKKFYKKNEESENQETNFKLLNGNFKK